MMMVNALHLVCGIKIMICSDDMCALCIVEET